MWVSKELEWIDIELTSFCNVKCNGCLRETEPLIKPLLNKTYIDLDVIRQKFKKNYFPNMKIINFCGSVDEPMSHPQIKDIIKYFSDWDIHLSIATNGSLRTEQWWADIAKIMPTSHKVTFGIDGLEDTLAIYRVNSNFNKVINNAKTFIKNGGKAVWQFIEFEHNKHQINECKEYAESLGFDKFRVITSARSESEMSKPLKYKRQKKIHDESQQIECKYLRDKRIFINHLGDVIPCCYLNATTLKYSLGNQNNRYNKTVENNGGKLAINLEYNSIEEVVEGDVFTDISNAWNTDTPYDVCHKKCKKNVRDKFTDMRL